MVQELQICTAYQSSSQVPGPPAAPQLPFNCVKSRLGQAHHGFGQTLHCFVISRVEAENVPLRSSNHNLTNSCEFVSKFGVFEIFQEHE